MSEELVPLRKSAKKALGRGLGSLLGEVAASNEESEFKRVETVARKTESAAPVLAQAPTVAVMKPEANASKIWTMPIEKIIPNKEQPRKEFKTERLADLAASIKEKGMLLPIIVRTSGENQFEIIAGERRWRAAQLAGFQQVPVIIREAKNQESLELALIENIQRQDINPIEEAEAYAILAAKYGLTQQQIAEKVSKERSTVANLMRLTTLSPEVKMLTRSGQLPIGQAKVLLAIEDNKIQGQVAQKVVKMKLSVRATERLVAKIKSGEESEIEIESIKTAPDVKPLISELQRILGTKVSIDMAGERSKVSIQFYSIPELNQFVDRLRKTRP